MGMIAFLQGTHIGEGVLLTAAGVGYQVHTTHALEQDATCSLHVTTVQTETSTTLFGFTDRWDKATFQWLITISGVGAKTALAALRELGAASVVAAFLAQDADTMRQVPGIGPVAARKMFANATVPFELAQHFADATVSPVAEVNGGDTLVQALGELRFSDSVAVDLAHRARLALPGATLPELISWALTQEVSA